jgi:predicted nucleotidyltransferase
MNKKNTQPEISERLIEKIVQRILNVADPIRIIVFGSAAAGTMTPDSDLDLLVIEDGFTNQRAENLRLRQALKDLEVPVDIFTMTSTRFDETKNVIGGLSYPANKYGKVVYETS